MKKYLNFINENDDLIDEDKLEVREFSYFDFINLCDVYKSIEHKDKDENTICKIINDVKEDPKTFSKHSNKYHFLAAIKKRKIHGIFYKQIIGNPDKYEMGFIISKGVVRELFSAMQAIGSYTTFTNIENIPSIKSQLAMGAEIICITDNTPNNTGNYNKDFTDQTKQLLIDEKIYYRDGEDELHLLDEKGNINIKGFVDFLSTHTRIELSTPKGDIGSKIKVYFLYNKT